MESKLSQKLAGIVHKPLFQVFLYVQKAYDSLDRGIYVEILRGYGLILNLKILLQRYWGEQEVVPKSRKIFGDRLVWREW